ncbi:MAG: hypothetical protein HOP28_11725 [Gemmatimonadales bacterium]|nr:hypothetical protein [Gemmatimonadales bacterium]
MNRYWLRIGLGALLVFGLGMTAIAGVRKGKAEVRSLLASVGSEIPRTLADLGFRLDGQRVGDITGLHIEPTGTAETGKIALQVALTDPAILEVLRDCSLALENSRRLDSRTGFRCADQTELTDGDMVAVGEVTFEPGNITRSINLPRYQADRWRRSQIRSLDATLAKDGSGGVRAAGSFDVGNRQYGYATRRGTFKLETNTEGAIVSVRDDRGRSLLDFRADQNGVNLSIRDREGRNLFRMLADSIGAAIRSH